MVKVTVVVHFLRFPLTFVGFITFPEVGSLVTVFLVLYADAMKKKKTHRNTNNIDRPRQRNRKKMGVRTQTKQI